MINKITFEKNNLGDLVGDETLNSWKIYINDNMFGIAHDLTKIKIQDLLEIYNDDKIMYESGIYEYAQYGTLSKMHRAIQISQKTINRLKREIEQLKEKE